MVAEPIHTDVSGLPDVAHLAREVERSGTPHVLEENGKPIARLVPVERTPKRPRAKRATAGERLRVPKMTLDELWKSRPPVSYERPFTDDEIKEALNEAREEAWERKEARSR